MRTGLVSVVFGLAAITPVSGDLAVAAWMTLPLPVEVTNVFKLNPQSLMLSPSTDTRTVEASTLAATGPQLASDLVHVAKTGKPRFQGPIAAGLTQAALACLGVDQHAAPRIQRAVAGFEDAHFQALFAAVVSDLSTAAIDGTISAAAGSAGAQSLWDGLRPFQ